MQEIAYAQQGKNRGFSGDCRATCTKVQARAFLKTLFDGQFRDDGKSQPAGAFARAAVWLVIALAALNVVSTLLECGFGACPDNPLAYELLKPTP